MIRHFGVYKATVINNNDPEKRNRVRVRVQGLMDGIPDAYLPWAESKSTTFVFGGSGQSVRPPKGAKVTVEFRDNGDINYPVWSGGIIEKVNDLPDADETGRYILFRSPDKKIVIAFNENTGQIELKTNKYNTTVDEFLDQILGHKHLVTVQGNNTTNPQLALPPDSMLPTIFNTGTL
jgi:phage baseplate assembly protein gpV